MREPDTAEMSRQLRRVTLLALLGASVGLVAAGFFDQGWRPLFPREAP